MHRFSVKLTNYLLLCYISCFREKLKRTEIATCRIVRGQTDYITTKFHNFSYIPNQNITIVIVTKTAIELK